MKDTFYEDKFPKYHTKILLEDFNVKGGRENIFKPTVWNEGLNELSIDNGVRVVNFATSKHLTVRSKFPHFVTSKNLLGYLLLERRQIKLAIF
jgi:hypothetical protein